MLEIFAVIFLVGIAGGSLMWVLCRDAVEGYQDELGFSALEPGYAAGNSVASRLKSAPGRWNSDELRRASFPTLRACASMLSAPFGELRQTGSKFDCPVVP